MGELGYELYPTADLAVSLYDAVVDAGADFGLRHAGYHALDSLRVEKGYRHLGHDIGPVDDPYQAGLGFTVALDKPGGFVGREAIAARAGQTPGPPPGLRPAPRPGAAAAARRVAPRGTARSSAAMTSGAYGHTLGAACGLGYLRGDVPAGDAFEVDCAGTSGGRNGVGDAVLRPGQRAAAGLTMEKPPVSGSAIGLVPDVDGIIGHKSRRR